MHKSQQHPLSDNRSAIMIGNQAMKDPRDLMNHAILNRFSILHSDGKSQLHR
jgi:hypothetical protein